MKAKVGIVVAFLVVIGIILAVRFMGGNGKGDDAAARASASASASVGGGGAGKPPVEISMLYSSEKKEWVEAAAVTFRKAHPEIKLTLIAKGSFDGMRGILDDKDKPTVFSPADSLVMSLLISDWKTKSRAPLFAAQGDDAPQSLVITPLVFVVWEDRAQVLAKAANGDITWKAIHKAVSSPKGWPAVGGKAEWGFVKLGHTDPTKSNSGLQALYLMSLEYFDKPVLEVGDLLKPEYQTYVKELEKGVTKFETSTGTFMTEMVRFGPTKDDIAVVYENLAISQLENAQGRWGNLKVYYPKTTLWSDHPAAVVTADWVTPAQKDAANLWLAHLRSKPVQADALTWGFRPGDPSIPVKTGDPANPYVKLAQYGIKIDVPPVAKTPDAAVVANLMQMWSRIAAPTN